jgi:hypothetical protein
MDHNPAVPEGPVWSAGSLIPDETVFHGDDVMGEFLPVKQVAKLAAKLTISIVGGLQDAVVYSEGVSIVVIQLMSRDLGIPARQVFTVEKLLPFLLVRVVLAESTRCVRKEDQQDE